MAYDYDPIVTLATRLIQEFGGSLTLRKYTNTGTKHNPTRTSSDSTIYGVVLDYRMEEIDDTRIKRGDKKILIDATPDIEPGNSIVTETFEYNVQDVQIINPGGTRLIQKIQVRK